MSECYNAVKVGPDSRGGVSVGHEIIFVDQCSIFMELMV